MSGQLDAIIALQNTLSELAEAEARLNGIPEWMETLHEEHSQQKAAIDAVAATGEEARHTRKGAEADLADAQEKLKHFQSQIGRVSTQREYGALLKEIDTVKERIAEFEKLALESLEASEASEAQHRELTEGFQDLDQRYQSELAKWEAEKPGVTKTIRTLSARADELREQIPLPQRRLFERLFGRNDGQALAPIHGMMPLRGSNRLWRCGVCNYQIRPQVVVEIRNQRSVIQCDCGKRILFVEEEEDDNA